jgi:predicted MFS family arabinose efflux permease
MRSLSGRSRVISLALSRSTPQAISLISSILLIEIALTFGRSIGDVSQMIALSSAFGIFTSLAMTLLAARYSPTHIHNIGLILCLISAIGSIFAPAYSVFFILYGLYIIGSNLVLPMTTTLIGELFSGEERSKSLGIIFAGQAVFYVLGYLVVGFISKWRLALAYFAVPFLALSFIVAFRVIPFVQPSGEKESISIGIRNICRSSSAIFCLIATAITGVWAVALRLSASYYRDVHGIPLSIVSILLAAFAFVYAVIMAFTTSFVSGANMPAASGLILGLVPKYKGSMMSLSSATGSIGASLNLGLMGYILNLYGWATGAMVVGALGIIGGVLVHLFVDENAK